MYKRKHYDGALELVLLVFGLELLDVHSDGLWLRDLVGIVVHGEILDTILRKVFK